MDLMMNHDQFSSHPKRGIGRFTIWLTVRFQEWKKLRQNNRAMSNLSAQTLRDIGLEEYASRRHESVLWLKL